MSDRTPACGGAGAPAVKKISSSDYLKKKKEEKENRERVFDDAYTAMNDALSRVNPDANLHIDNAEVYYTTEGDFVPVAVHSSSPFLMGLSKCEPGSLSYEELLVCTSGVSTLHKVDLPLLKSACRYLEMAVIARHEHRRFENLDVRRFSVIKTALTLADFLCIDQVLLDLFRVSAVSHQLGSLLTDADKQRVAGLEEAQKRAFEKRLRADHLLYLESFAQRLENADVSDDEYREFQDGY